MALMIKECQKAAWPGHRISCRRMKQEEEQYKDLLDREAQRLGYTSSATLTKTFTDFLNAHQWTLNEASLAHIMLRSGPSMDIARSNERLELLIFRFRCEPMHTTPHSQRNPADAFTLIEHGFFNALQYTSSGILRLKPCLDLIKESTIFHTQQLERNKPRYVGCMPILYALDGMVGQTSRLFPVYLPVNTFVMNDFTIAALQEFVALLANTMNYRLPLRVVDERHPFHPVPGHIVRSGGKWVWEPLFAAWEDYEAGRAMCGRLTMLEGPRTGWPLASLMDVFCQFWGIKVHNNVEEASGAGVIQTSSSAAQRDEV
ncbi:hypothetical protein VTO73DRAFT_14259 [Trametes versicolor]